MTANIPILLQATASGGVDIKLALPACDGAAADQIVVCGKRSDKYRIPPSPPAGDADLPPARFKLFGQVPTRVHAQQIDVGGTPSQRVMVTFSVAF